VQIKSMSGVSSTGRSAVAHTARRKTIRFWNELGRRFPRSFFGSPTTRFYLSEEQRLIEQHAGDLRGKRVLKLDLWNEAQNTEVLFWMMRQGARCAGVDIAGTTARKARDRGREHRLALDVAVADAVSLPFAPASFDLVYTMGTLEHIEHPEPAIAELARVLRDEGVALIGVPNRRDPFLFALASRLAQALGRYPYGYERWYTSAELRELVEGGELRVSARDTILFLPWFLRAADIYLWISRPWLSRPIAVLVQPFRWAARLRACSRRLGYLTVCVARKGGRRA